MREQYRTWRDTPRAQGIVTAEEWNAGCTFKYEATVVADHRNDMTFKIEFPSVPTSAIKYRYSNSTGGWVDATDYTSNFYVDTMNPIKTAGWVDAGGDPRYMGYDAHKQFRVIACGFVRNGLVGVGVIIHRIFPLNPSVSSGSVTNNSQSYYVGYSGQLDATANKDSAMRIEVFPESPSSNIEVMEVMNVTRYQ